MSTGFWRSKLSFWNVFFTVIPHLKETTSPSLVKTCHARYTIRFDMHDSLDYCGSMPHKLIHGWICIRVYICAYELRDEKCMIIKEVLLKWKQLVTIINYRLFNQIWQHFIQLYKKKCIISHNLLGSNQSHNKMVGNCRFITTILF